MTATAANAATTETPVEVVKTIKVDAHTFRLLDNGTIEQWNHIRNAWGKPWKNVDLDAVKAAFHDTDAAPNAAEVPPEESPELAPPKELTPEEQELEDQRAALAARMAEAQEALKKIKEKKAALARAKAGAHSRAFGERRYRGGAQVALIGLLQPGETYSLSDILGVVPEDAYVTEKNPTPSELDRVRFIRRTLGDMSAPAIAGSKVLNLTYSEAGVAVHEQSEDQKAEVSFWVRALQTAKASSPQQAPDLGTVSEFSE